MCISLFNCFAYCMIFQLGPPKSNSHSHKLNKSGRPNKKPLIHILFILMCCWPCCEPQQQFNSISFFLSFFISIFFNWNLNMCVYARACVCFNFIAHFLFNHRIKLLLLFIIHLFFSCCDMFVCILKCSSSLFFCSGAQKPFALHSWQCSCEFETSLSLIYVYIYIVWHIHALCKHITIKYIMWVYQLLCEADKKSNC